MGFRYLKIISSWTKKSAHFSYPRFPSIQRSFFSSMIFANKKNVALLAMALGFGVTPVNGMVRFTCCNDACANTPPGPFDPVLPPGCEEFEEVIAPQDLLIDNGNPICIKKGYAYLCAMTDLLGETIQADFYCCPDCDAIDATTGEGPGCKAFFESFPLININDPCSFQN